MEINFILSCESCLQEAEIGKPNGEILGYIKQL